MKRRLLQGMMVIAVMALTISLASPAFGGPSPLKVAKKALKIGKKANKRAVNAQKTADSALTKANALGAITRVEGPLTAIPADTARTSTATCPAGQQVLSGGGSAITADGLAVSEPSESRISWSVIGYSSSISGTIQAVALCAPGGKAVAANRRAEARELEGKEARVEAAGRRR